ncbi:hypothetical protein C7T94_12645 [Pedobacter yulinensis]|uniref:Outer membrane protein beta-barrel domain-containing protein n=1 Tax=Pedobacter yulinensis TaxID=2126353 RepID=A0A2T3HLV2_9SPHI|nr:hypothetical protein [Pedobacter yulinensis]PST83409.1 hypothetical protein C7T94_12645 [Pedobacter yulinensis]
MKNKIFLPLLLVTTGGSYAQQAPVQAYPRIAVYAGILHPVVTFSKTGTDANFGDHYVVGMPVGINIWKNKTIGFSAEFVPTVRAENRTSKMANFTFHPGLLVALGKGFTFAGRAAFETSGRYGLTPVLNKTIIKGKTSSMFAAVPLPVRFGNDKPTSLTLGFQFGIAF